MTEIKLRPYQREAIDAVFKAWSEGVRRPAIVLPTGAGKTVVFSALVKEFRQSVVASANHPAAGVSQQRGKRVIILAHRDELVDQAIAKLRAVMPGVNVGKVKAGINDVDADVMVCSVQTLTSEGRRLQLEKRQARNGKVGLIITDECHHATATSYQKIYAAFPDALQIGVTATMIRGDGNGLGDQWEQVVYKRSILWMISKGFLTDVRTRQVDLKALDLASVKRTFASRTTSAGDWQAGDLGRALMEAEAHTAIARAYLEHAGDRQGIVFTPTVETAAEVEDELNRSGIQAMALTGTTSRPERHRIFEAFRRDEIQVLVNCMVLTEGFDMPQVSCIVVARPTSSQGLYTQMVGRGLRPFPGKRDCLVLDLVGASATNRLRTLIDLEPGAVTALRPGESLAEAVVREEEEKNRKVPAGSLAFELRARDVDSFGSSGTEWIRTPKGVMFIECGAATRVFLWPSAESGMWDVCRVTEGEQWHRTEYTGLSIGEAMAWAEAVAEDHAGFSVQKSARWRKGKPSEAQVNMAYALVVDPTGMNKGQLSYAISKAVGAELFDPYVKG